MQHIENIIQNIKKTWFERMPANIINTKLLWLGLLGIVLLLIGGTFDSLTPPSKTEMPTDTVRQAVPNDITYESALAEKLASLLSRVKGAGAVAVSITLDHSKIQEHAKNITKESKVLQEKDSSGAVRTTTETKESEQIVIRKENGTDHPVIVGEVQPTIKGVLVIAEGAYDSTVKANLTKGVETALGVPAYRITVLTQKK